MVMFFSFLSLVIGLVIGSFLNCLIWRLHSGESLGGRSHCPKCRRPIAWYDNIPVLSFIFLGGRCRQCRATISWQYPLVELATALLFFASFRIFLTAESSFFFLAQAWILIATLVVVFVFDWRWQLIPMAVLWPMTVLLFFLNILSGQPWLNNLIAGASFAAFFGLQYLITKGRGIGEGDIWLGLFLGLAFPSFSQLFLLVLLAYSAGSAVGGLLMLRGRKKWCSRIALGPFLAFAAIITLIWGEAIISWYLGLF